MNKAELAHCQRAILDLLQARLGARNDAKLALCLEEAVIVISRASNGAAPIGPSLVLRILEKEAMTIKEIRHMLGPKHPFNRKQGSIK